jgi:hypothetical protein
MASNSSSGRPSVGLGFDDSFINDEAGGMIAALPRIGKVGVTLVASSKGAQIGGKGDGSGFGLRISSTVR